jgi:hypothetical protein
LGVDLGAVVTRRAAEKVCSAVVIGAGLSSGPWTTVLSGESFTASGLGVLNSRTAGDLFTSRAGHARPDDGGRAQEAPPQAATTSDRWMSTIGVAGVLG